MKLIFHRRNKISDLLETNPKYGVEVDIRSEGDQLITNHDPWCPGESFEQWIDLYNHGTLILNVKEEGLESRLISIMKSKNISDYFFLDQSFPFLVKFSKAGESKCAVRVSDLESIETAIALAGQVDWVWVDWFNHFPLSKSDSRKLKEAGFQICIVSPELHGRNPRTEIPKLFSLLGKLDIKIDAVCTKHPLLWEKVLTLS